MGRSGYSDDCTDWSLICWRGAVNSAIRGKRGQAFLIELRDALDALPDQKLCGHDFQRPDGACCAIGAVGKARGIDMTDMDPEGATESGQLTEMFNIANAMVREIEFMNDDDYAWWGQKDGESMDEYNDRMDSKRWTRVREWADRKIKSTAPREHSQPTNEKP